MKDFESVTDYVMTTILDMANIDLIRKGKRRKIVTDDYVIFDKHYYFDTYGLEGEKKNDMDAGCDSCGFGDSDTPTGGNQKHADGPGDSPDGGTAV